MSNSLEQGILQAEAALDKLKIKFESIDTSILEISKNARGIGDADTSSLNTKQVNAQLKQTNKIVRDLNKQVQRQERENAKLEKRIQSLVNVRTQSNKKTTEEIVNNGLLRRSAILYAIATSELSTEYEKLDAETKILIRRQKDLNVQKLRDVGLTRDQEEELEQLNAQVKENSAALALVDQKAGQFHRNVGNYKSGFDGLGFSIAQVTREAPAFANSVQTGFMAISNNIPMVVDEINKLRVANQRLAAEGQPTTSVIKSLGKALIGWQTLLSVGVTLLTVYGDELVNFIAGQNEAETATDKATKEIEEQNEALRDNIALRRLRVSNISNFLNENTKELREALTTYGDGTKRQSLLLAEIADRFEDLGVKNADFLKDESILTNLRVRAAINLLDIEKAQIDLQEKRAKSQEISKKIAESEANEALRGQNRERVLNDLNIQRATTLTEILDIQGKIQDLEAANKGFFADKGVEIEGTNRPLAKTSNIFEILGKQTKDLESQITKLFSQGKIDADTFINALYDIGAAYEIISKESATALQGGVNSLLVDHNELLEGTKRLADEATKKYKKLQGALNKKIDLGLEQQILTGIQLFGSLANLGRQFSQARIEDINAEINANNDKYTQILNNEQLTEEQRSAIEAERDAKEARLEQKRRAEQRRQARIQKAFNIAQIIGNTAVAISKALAQGGFILGVPQAAIVAAIGAVQLAAAIAQPIPAFKDGHFEGSYQGKAKINDALGSKFREIVHRKDGSMEMFNGRNKVIDMKKGDRVYPADMTQGIIENELLNRLNISFAPKAKQSNGITDDQMNKFAIRVSRSIQSRGQLSDASKAFAKEMSRQNRINKA